MSESLTRTPLHDLEKRLLGRLRPWAGLRLLVALSGGRDSVALFHLLVQLQTRLKFDLRAAHIHHGEPDASDPASAAVRAYRDDAQRFCGDLARQWKIPYLTNEVRKERPASKVLRSEEELRAWRHDLLEEMRKREGCDRIVTAHHQQDQLETRLIRLIRGTGPDGLQGMVIDEGRLLRPFLEVGLEELDAYAQVTKIEWRTDPSNQETGPLRNWVRQVWLPELEKKRPGGVATLGRSLESVVEVLNVSKGEELELWFEGDPAKGLDRALLREIPTSLQRLWLARYFRYLGIRNFGRSHIDEICKRLDTSRKQFCFKVLRLDWSINAEQIRASAISQPTGERRIAQKEAKTENSSDERGE